MFPHTHTLTHSQWLIVNYESNINIPSIPFNPCSQSQKLKFLFVGSFILFFVSIISLPTSNEFHI